MGCKTAGEAAVVGVKELMLGRMGEPSARFEKKSEDIGISKTGFNIVVVTESTDSRQWIGSPYLCQKKCRILQSIVDDGFEFRDLVRRSIK